jgi:ssRNA-specific RNase YbeY (16S rRNA maturation enzyme)
MTVEVRNRQPRRVNTRALKQLAKRVLSEVEGAGSISTAAFDLSLVLVSDGEMAELNLRYHQMAGPTDILTFDYGEGRGELIVYIIHGILHLTGHDDRTSAQRKKMRAAERRLLALHWPPN